MRSFRSFFVFSRFNPLSLVVYHTLRERERESESRAIMVERTKPILPECLKDHQQFAVGVRFFGAMTRLSATQSKFFSLVGSFLLCAGVRVTWGFTQPMAGLQLRQVGMIQQSSASNYQVFQRTWLLASNESIPELDGSLDDDSDASNPLIDAKGTWARFTTSSLYRTILVSGAFFTSPKIRSVISPPILVGLFLIALAVYTYQDRFDNLADLTGPRRQAALRNLRQAKADQLSSKASAEDISLYAKAYEDALREELAVRVIIPGIWYVRMDPNADDWSAAPQFLGLEITENYELKRLDE